MPLDKRLNAYRPDLADARLAAGWDDAVRFAATHVGEFDHALPAPKHHVYRFARATGSSRPWTAPSTPSRRSSWVASTPP